MVQKSEHTSHVFHCHSHPTRNTIIPSKTNPGRLARFCLLYISTSTLILLIKTYPNPFTVLRPEGVCNAASTDQYAHASYQDCHQEKVRHLFPWYLRCRSIPIFAAPFSYTRGLIHLNTSFTSCVVMPPQDCSWRPLGLLASLSICLAECEA